MSRQDWCDLFTYWGYYAIGAFIAVPLTVLIFGLIGGHL